MSGVAVWKGEVKQSAVIHYVLCFLVVLMSTLLALYRVGLPWPFSLMTEGGPMVGSGSHLAGGVPWGLVPGGCDWHALSLGEHGPGVPNVCTFPWSWAVGITNSLHMITHSGAACTLRPCIFCDALLLKCTAW